MLYYVDEIFTHMIIRVLFFYIVFYLFYIHPTKLKDMKLKYMKWNYLYERDVNPEKKKKES